MGVISAFVWIILPGISFCTYVTFRQGAKLPQITRKTGQSIGMGYNYLRLVLKHIIPKSHESIEVVRKMRQVGQQAFAFSNEVKWNLLETKPILKEAFPGLSEDPFDKFGLRAEETAKEIKPIPITSSVLIADAFNQKAEIIKRKKEKESEER